MNTKRITTLKNWKWRDWFGSVEWSLELNLDIGMNSIIMNNGWLIMVYWVQAIVILWLIKCVMNTWLDWMDILKWWRRDTRRIQWDPKSPDWFSALEAVSLTEYCLTMLIPLIWSSSIPRMFLIWWAFEKSMDWKSVIWTL